MRALTPADIWNITVLTDVEISPSGDRIAFVVNTLDKAGDQELSAIWLIDTKTKAQKQLTDGPNQDASPRWSPDGKRLAFVSKTSQGARNVFVTDETLAKPVQLTHFDTSIDQFVWSPDGRFICCVARGPKLKSFNPKALEYETLNYRSHLDGWFDGRYRHLWLADVRRGEVTQLTDFDTNDMDPAFSPSGDAIAFASNRTPEHDLTKSLDIWILPLEGNDSLRCLTQSDGVYAKPDFSPDGQKVAFVGRRGEPGDESVNGGILVMDRDGGSQENILANWDRPAKNLLLTETRSHAPGLAPVWSNDGSTIYFLGTDHGSVNLYGVSSKGGQPTLVTQGDHELWKVSFDASRRKFAALITSPTEPGNVCLGTLDGKVDRLTTMNASIVEEAYFAPYERVWLRGDGEDFEAFLAKPANFDPSRKYPLIVRLPGGPHLAYGFSFVDDVQILVGMGFVVASLNHHGTQSYGQAFSAAVNGDWCGIDARDVLSGVDHLVKMGFVDETRIGMTGGSYGGLMVLWLAGQTDRFAAAVSQRTISDLVSGYGTSEHGGSLLDPGMGGKSLYDDPQRYLAISPIMHAKNVHTPLLLMQCGKDTLTPTGQAEEMYVALKLLRRPVRMIIYPDEIHYIRRYGSPTSRVHYSASHVGWFEQHLLEPQQVAAATRSA